MDEKDRWMVQLVIAEKPSVAKDIARVLKAGTSRSGYLEGEGYIVSWTVGHLCNIAAPEEQNKDWHRWRMSTLPMLPDRFKLTILPNTGKQFHILKRLLKNPNISRVIAATDAGREGELIFRRVYQAAGCNKPIMRLWLSSMTDEAIRSAFSALRPGGEFRHLAAASYARAESDWLVGMNETRAFTLKCGGELVTIGRVQTPVLAMLVKRRREIENFVPRTFWEIEALFEKQQTAFKAVWHAPPTFKETRIFESEQAERIHRKCAGHPAVVDGVRQKKGMRRPPLLYDLTSLQRTCNSRFGFAAKKTLSIAQALYDGKKAITYPRTDSQYISKDVFKDIARHFVAIRDRYPELIARLRQTYTADDRKYRVVNDGKVSDHHAIIPTTRAMAPGALDRDQQSVYDLICRRFTAAFLPAAELLSTEVWFIINQEKFKSSGSVFRQLGWLEAEPWAIRNDVVLPVLRQGESLQVKELNRLEKQTKAPPHYTDASLLRAMETAGRQVEDEELAAAMKERGLGTPATRAAIIEALLEKKRRYAARQGKSIVPTDKGVEVVRIVHELFPDALSPDLTGEWEAKLAQIEKGRLRYADFMQEIRAYVATSIAHIKQARLQYDKTLIPDKNAVSDPASSGTVLGRCPLCSGDVKETSKAYSCANWQKTGCRFAIWKNSFGGRIATRDAVELLQEGRTKKKLTLKSNRTKKQYKARLQLADGKVRPLFDAVPQKRTPGQGEP